MPRAALKILADENMPLVEEIFSEFGEVQRLPGRTMSASDLQEVDVLLVRSITQVNAKLLQQSPVQFVGTATIGMDHIDQTYLNQRDISFSNAPGCNADAVVEYVLSSIFLLAQRHGFDPRSRVYGIVGVGNVGSRLQRRLQGLGYQVLLNDPPRAEQEQGFVSLDQLLQQADFICLHTPLTKEGNYPTQHLIAQPQLEQLKPGTVLLNAGRGPVIDNQALLQTLQQRKDLSAVLDVWEHEPAVDPELAALCELVSPHIAGYSLDGKIRGTYMLYQAFCQHLGVEVKRSLSDFLPRAELSHIDESGLSALDLMQKVYDPLQDDANLRAILSLPLQEQKQAFDQLRKQYRVRREFASLTVANSTQSDLLKGLGFQLAD